MNVAKVVAIVLAPSAAVGAVLLGPRAVRSLRRRLHERTQPLPAGPPIEQLAADLRRLVRQHHAVKRAPDLMMRAHHLSAIEGAITTCAVQAAVALGVPHPRVPRHSALTTTELKRLLRALADAGLVLPTGVGPLADS
ncbi:MAG: hypothetical protein AUG44_13935 [Actinobacteria bacterium 13_1_20CM_3_71_11]|nr:MAG: hypothetical protein AUG44_13935 [Actinobacteria bacterium 13_1_20CM_3_71_11]